MKNGVKRRGVKLGAALLMAAFLLVTPASLPLGDAGIAAAQGEGTKSEPTATPAPYAALQACQVDLALSAGEGCHVSGTGTSFVIGRGSGCIVLYDPSLLAVCHAAATDSSTVLSASKADDGSWTIEEISATPSSCGELTGLHEAVRLGNTEWVACLAAAGAGVNARDEEGDTPLQIAVERGSVELTQILIAAGADVSLPTYGESPVPIGLRELNQVLAGAGSDATLLGAEVVAKAERGVTPLQIAAANGNLKLVQVLVEARMAAPEPVEGTETPKLTTAATPEPSSALRQPVNETDRETLVAFYHATDGPDWVNNDNWLSDRPLSEWYGVFTDSLGRVTELHLQNNRVGGELPAELGQLTNLKRLLLHRDFWHGVWYSNPIRGEIPLELGQLTNLEELSLISNELSGEIPADLGQLSNLKELRLSNNDLNGNIPAELSQLNNLKHLLLARNDLSGEIPAELGQLTNLEFMDLSYNELGGEIPSELGKLSNLKALYLDWSGVDGCVPDALRGVEENDFDELGLPFCAALAKVMGTDREALAAFFHATNGPGWRNNEHWLSDRPIGEWYGVTIGRSGHVIELDLQKNQLSGTIPPELAQLSDLEELSLSDNRLSGAIPSEFGQLFALEWLYLSSNDLSGEIPAELGSLSNLIRLDLQNNQLSGEIPSEIGQLFNLIWLDLENNQFSGGIPAELGQLSKLVRLRLSDNELTGCVPDTLSELRYNDFDQLGLQFCPTGP